MKQIGNSCGMLLSILLLICCWGAYAAGIPEQTTSSDAGSASDLAKQVQNPVADLISVPFQYNAYFDTGPEGGTLSTLLIQPVIPMDLNETWNFIARPIVPLIHQPAFVEGQGRECGVGNLQFQGFFSPKEEVGGWILGFGPYLEFPTSSDDRLGSDNWSAGPAVVMLQVNGPWVYGGLLTHLWSYTGPDSEINLTSLQPFINYNMPDGWYLSASPVITADWTADSSEQWTIPVGGGLGKVFKIGEQPVNAALKAYYNVESPRSGADWQLQFQIQLLFPK